jgi:hypothetical protein
MIPEVSRRRCLIVVMTSPAALLTPLFARDPPMTREQIRDLLDKAAGVYSAAAVHCSMELQTLHTSDGDLGPPAYLLMDHSDQLWRLEIRHGRKWIYILGTEHAWNYHPSDHEYLEKPLTHERAQNIRDVGKEWSRQHAERFCLLPKMDARIEFRRWDQLKNKAGKFRCAVLHIDPGASAGWKELLWIDPLAKNTDWAAP